MNCAACGKGLNYGSRFCSNCGQAIPDPSFTPSAQPYTPYQRIVRPRYGRMIGGVCAGLAQHMGWDVALVRVLLVVLVFFGCGTPDPGLLHRLDCHPQRALLVPHRPLRANLHPTRASTRRAHDRPNRLKRARCLKQVRWSGEHVHIAPPVRLCRQPPDLLRRRSL